jgi:hypothetical protein
MDVVFYPHEVRHKPQRVYRNQHLKPEFIFLGQTTKSRINLNVIYQILYSSRTDNKQTSISYTLCMGMTQGISLIRR